MIFPRFFMLSLAGLFALSSCVVEDQSSQGKLLTEADAIKPLTVANNVAPNPDSGVSKVVMGLQHACAIRAGKLSCWGLNKHGQIGNGESGVIAGKADSLTRSSYTVKVAEEAYTVFADGVSDVAVGYEHTCAIKNDELFCWGSNEFSQLGLPASPSDPADFIFPRPVSVLKNAKQVVSRGRLTCVVANTQLLCFGTRIEISDSQKEQKLVSKTPKIFISGGVSSVALSANHGCAKVGNALRCFGLNTSGEVGNGDMSVTDVAAPYEVFRDGVSTFAVTDGRSCAVVGGVMKCFGASLGDRAVDATGGAWKVASPNPYDAAFWTTIGAGLQISASGAVLSSDGDLMYGSYFHSKGIAQKVAIGVTQFDFSETDVAGCMMFRNHAVKCWGSNLFGQLGTGARSAEEPSIFKARDVVFK